MLYEPFGHTWKRIMCITLYCLVNMAYGIFLSCAVPYPELKIFICPCHVNYKITVEKFTLKFTGYREVLQPLYFIDSCWLSLSLPCLFFRCFHHNALGDWCIQDPPSRAILQWVEDRKCCKVPGAADAFFKFVSGHGWNETPGANVSYVTYVELNLFYELLAKRHTDFFVAWTQRLTKK